MKPLASLSLDLDNKWSYLKTHGDEGWQGYPSYLNVAVPRILALLESRSLKATVFVVGQDAGMEVNRDPLRSIAAADHEIGNHSFKHEPWLHLYSDGEVDAELAAAEEAIEGATGKRPIGFRGPGFSLSAAVLRTLSRRGYRYDASTFPTFLGPLARAYYFMSARLSAEERRRRQALFGSLVEGLRPVEPYLWRVGTQKLLEIPVTTMPILRAPFHVSYVVYLSTFSRALAVGYFRAALGLCGMTGTAPSLLLHPLDFLGGDDTDRLEFFPGMGLSGSYKQGLVAEILDLLADRYRVVPLREHAQALENRGTLPLVTPRFRPA